jgi:trimeric autotransporter adhesin
MPKLLAVIMLMTLVGFVVLRYCAAAFGRIWSRNIKRQSLRHAFDVLLAVVLIVGFANPVFAEILSPATINGSFATGGSPVDNGTCTTATNLAGTTGTATGTLTGLGTLGINNFSVTASIVRGASSNSVWGQGVCFPSANTIRFQPNVTPTTSNGTDGPGYGNYVFDFNAPVGGLSFRINGMDNGDYAEVFAFNGATPVPVAAGNFTPSALLTGYTPLVNRFSGAATDPNARGYRTPDSSGPQNLVVTFPVATNVSRIIVRYGKTGTLISTATSMFSDFKWNVVTSISMTKALSGNRLVDTNEFTVGIRTGGGAGPLVSSATNATSTGTGSTVDAGTGTTGTFVATSGTTYTLTEVVAGTTNLTQYSSSISCSDSNSLQTGLPSGVAFTGGATAGAGFTLTPVPGAVISCTLTNSPRPRISLVKALGSSRIANTDEFTVAIRTGGVGGTVVNSTLNSTTQGNGSTVTPNTGTTGTVTATAGTTYTLTEVTSGTTNLALYAGTITCTDSAGLQTGLPSSAVYSTTTGLAITPVSGANIACTITNTVKAPTIGVLKLLGANRSADTDQFTVAVRTGGASGPVVSSTGNSTTTGSGSTVTANTGTTGSFTATAGTAYTLTETASGTTNFAQYTSTISCVDGAGFQTGLPSGATFNTTTGFTITPVIGAEIACVLTNTARAPTLGMLKLLGSNRVAATDQFTVALRTGGVSGTVVNVTTNATTGGSGSTVTANTGTTGTFTATTGTAYTLTESASGTTNLAQYTGTITCVDGAGFQTGLPSGAAFDPAAGLTITPVGGATIACVLTNTVKAPTLNLTKALGSNRVAATDQFTVALRTGGVSGTVVSSAANSTTTGATNVVASGSGTTGVFTAIAGTAYTLTETAAGTTDFAKYSSTLSCSDSAGLQAGLPSNASYSPATGLAVTPVAGAIISCTLTNTANNPIVTLAKLVVNTGGGTAVASAWTLTASGPTNISGSTGTATVTAASVGAGAYTLSESGGPADINGGAADYNASTYSCVVNGAAAVAGNSITLNLGDTTVCTITNTFVPDTQLSIVKRLQTGTPTPLQANQAITYEFEVTNGGNVTLTGVNIDETAFNGSGTIGTFTPPNGSVTLVPGASTTYTATYTVSQTDVDLRQ